MPGREDVDLCVLGGGSGGVRAARRAAALGARVVLVEDRALGGTCVHAGCIPKKLFVYASRFARSFEDARGYGWSVPTASFDWAALVTAKDVEVARLAAVYRRLLDDAGVEVLAGRGILRDAHHVQVGDRLLSTRHLVLATGGRPFVPDVPGCERAITSDDAFHLPSLPRRMVVVGGGYVALELASIARGLGVEVTLVHRGERLLRGFDADVRTVIGEELARAGISIRCEEQVAAIEVRERELAVRLAGGSAHACDLVLFATGRRPTTAGLGLESAGVALREDGAVLVDAFGRTSVPSVYAVGDVTGGTCLTPVAVAQGEAVARTLFAHGPPVALDPTHVPTCVFSQPAVASVGTSEEEARTRHAGVRVFRSRFRPLEHALSGRDERMFVKLVVDAESDRVLGVHVVGGEAAEIVQGFAVALRCGVTKAQLDATIGIHPTAAEELLTLREPAG